jgi:hypothetical protein
MGSSDFKVLAVVFVVIGAACWILGEDIKGCIAVSATVMCFGFSCILRKLDDLNKN